MNLLDLILDRVLLYHDMKHLDSTFSDHKHNTSTCDLHLPHQKSYISNQQMLSSQCVCIFIQHLLQEPKILNLKA